MNIQTDKIKTIYKYTTDNKEYYSVGLTHKKQDGSYEMGFISCRFKKNIKLEHKTKILIKGGWIDFVVKDKKTIPFIFINEFEIVQDEQDNIQDIHTKTTYDNDKTEIKLNDNDLPW